MSIRHIDSLVAGQILFFLSSSGGGHRLPVEKYTFSLNYAKLSVNVANFYKKTLGRRKPFFLLKFFLSAQKSCSKQYWQNFISSVIKVLKTAKGIASPSLLKESFPQILCRLHDCRNPSLASLCLDFCQGGNASWHLPFSRSTPEVQIECKLVQCRSKGGVLNLQCSARRN